MATRKLPARLFFVNAKEELQAFKCLNYDVKIEEHGGEDLVQESHVLGCGSCQNLVDKRQVLRLLQERLINGGGWLVVEEVR